MILTTNHIITTTRVIMDFKLLSLNKNLWNTIETIRIKKIHIKKDYCSFLCRIVGIRISYKGVHTSKFTTIHRYTGITHNIVIVFTIMDVYCTSTSIDFEPQNYNQTIRIVSRFPHATNVDIIRIIETHTFDSSFTEKRIGIKSKAYTTGSRHLQ